MEETTIILKLDRCPLEPNCVEYESFVYAGECMHYVNPFCEVENEAHLDKCRRKIREIYLDE